MPKEYTTHCSKPWSHAPITLCAHSFLHVPSCTFVLYPCCTPVKQPPLNVLPIHGCNNEVQLNEVNGSVRTVPVMLPVELARLSSPFWERKCGAMKSIYERDHCYLAYARWRTGHKRDSWYIQPCWRTGHLFDGLTLFTNCTILCKNTVPLHGGRRWPLWGGWWWPLRGGQQ